MEYSNTGEEQHRERGMEEEMDRRREGTEEKRGDGQKKREDGGEEKTWAEEEKGRRRREEMDRRREGTERERHWIKSGPLGGYSRRDGGNGGMRGSEGERKKGGIERLREDREMRWRRDEAWTGRMSNGTERGG